MIALVVLYTAVAATLCALAAACAERAALIAGRPARWTWLGAIVGSVLLPVAALWPTRPAPASGASLAALLELVFAMSGGAGTAGVGGSSAAGAPTLAPREGWPMFDRPLAAIWAVLASVALLRLVVRAVRTRQAIAAAAREGHARRHVLGRARVLVTPMLGPAVLGGSRATLVLPRWVLDESMPMRRRLVFAHEAEHLRAGDPALLVAAAAVVALVPWSPAGWWMLARLRAAVELDCDRRVLATAAVGSGRAAVPVAAYGALLLDVAARHAAAPDARPQLVPALATPARSILERRIRQMTSSRPAHMRAQFGLLAAGALACAAVACELPRPTGPRSEALSLASITPGALSPQSRDLTPDAVRAVVDGSTRTELAATTGRTRKLYVVENAGGDVRTVLGARGDGMPNGGRGLLPRGATARVRMRTFAPGTLGADSVAVAWVRVDATSERTLRVRSDTATPARTAGDTARPATMDSALVVVDGRQMGRGSAAITAINSDSIASVDVLKGAAAIARYGEAGRAGVIVVTRKHAAP